MIADAVRHTHQRLQADRRSWYVMLSVSLLFHAAVVASGALWSGAFASRDRFAPVYAVDLVTLAEPASKTSKTTWVQAAPKTRPIPLQRFRSQESGVSLKKRQGPLPRLPRQQEEEVLEKALAKLKKPPSPPSRPSPPPKVVAKPPSPPPTAAAKKKVSLAQIGKQRAGELSQALGLYRALIYDTIVNNWILPERLQKDPTTMEAVVVVKVQRDGTVTDIRFDKRSGDPYFDDSVLKAVLKSRPFPPFPDIYSPKEEEIVIRFAPTDGRS